jgi:hypothetical protein
LSRPPGAAWDVTGRRARASGRPRLSITLRRSGIRFVKNDDVEKLGAFYPAQEYDPKGKEARLGLLLYDSNPITMYAVCVAILPTSVSCLMMARWGRVLINHDVDCRELMGPILCLPQPWGR